jgi:hypothetical protein
VESRDRFGELNQEDISKLALLNSIAPMKPEQLIQGMTTVIRSLSKKDSLQFLKWKWVQILWGLALVATIFLVVKFPSRS